MSNLLVTVWAQADYVCAVHSFIQELLLRVALGLLKDRSYILSDAQFKIKIESAIIEASVPTATANDYIRAIVNVACREMEDLCRLLKYASGLAGLDRIAAEYLDTKRFREMLMRRDSEKLERLVAIVKEREGKPIKILMDVAKVLNDGAECYDEMAATAKRKAATELKMVIKNVTNIVTEAESRLGGKIDANGEKIDALNEKVSRLKVKAKRKRAYTDAQRDVCCTYWDAAQTNTEVKHAINTRITHESVFNYFKIKLAKVGVTKLSMFKAVLHSAQNMECAQRKRELDAKREAERKAKSATRKCGIIRGKGF